mmetsp:Transcript_26037/g.68332  ORF Transcript_26037/g.68332 Transcript_26037/m.68332 type:complete len:228 (-) Transcript_26037:399-1082(-)
MDSGVTASRSFLDSSSVSRSVSLSVAVYCSGSSHHPFISSAGAFSSANFRISSCILCRFSRRRSTMSRLVKILSEPNIDCAVSFQIGRVAAAYPEVASSAIVGATAHPDPETHATVNAAVGYSTASDTKPEITRIVASTDLSPSASTPAYRPTATASAATGACVTVPMADSGAITAVLSKSKRAIRRSALSRSFSGSVPTVCMATYWSEIPSARSSASYCFTSLYSR